jgi:hypothetical protein
MPRALALLMFIPILASVCLHGQMSTSGVCFSGPETFALKNRDLAVWRLSGGVLFTSGMTVDADGAPNAYGPKNKGLDYTANARGPHGWAALVTDRHGKPVLQKHGEYRGFYVSTTSLEQSHIENEADPKRYIDARKIAYIALPRDFAERFGITLGDLAIVFNEATGRSAYAIFADIGPRGKIGEGSIALARELGIPADPRHGQAFGNITYLIFPGSAGGWRQITAARVRLAAATLHHQWIGESTSCYINPDAR